MDDQTLANLWQSDKGAFAPPSQADGPVTSILNPMPQWQVVKPSDPLFGTVVQLVCSKSAGPPVEYGSGVFIRQDIVLTAAHVVFGGQFGGYAAKVSALMPTPAGVVNFAAAPLAVPDAYAKNPNLDSMDVALLRISPPSSAPLRPLWTPVAASDAAIQQGSLRVSGYPTTQLNLYTGSGPCRGLQPGLVFHGVDTSNGQSGSPLQLNGAQPLTLVGIHRAGVEETPPPFWPANGAVRITPALIGWFGQILSHVEG